MALAAMEPMLEDAPEPSPWSVTETPPELLKRAPSLWRTRLTAIQQGIGPREVLVTLGLLLLGRGCYLLSPAAGYGVPGLILLWWALPQRPRFLEPKPPTVNIVQPPADGYRPGVPNGRA